MFLVKDQRNGATTLVFTWQDPRKSGYKGQVEDDVTLDYDMDYVERHPDGTRRPEKRVGRAPDNPKHYKVFKYATELQEAGFEPVAGNAFVFGSWSDFVRLLLDHPPNPEDIDEADWFDYLDRVDDEARRLRQRSPWPETPRDASRDAVAEWLAKQHFITDPSTREIWYLPQGAPPNEIRFLEVSERVLGNEEKVEPFDFGVEELGAKFRLSIADISRDQFEQIQRDPGVLPPGWVIDGNIVWRRRDR